MRAVTDLTKYRMVRQRPATDWLRQHESVEQIAATNWRMICAMQRSWLRIFVR